MMRRAMAVAAMVCGLSGSVVAQGTKLWNVDQYSDMAKGTAEGVAIRSDGRLEAGPATSLLYATSASYVWSMAADANGNGYAGLGGTASGAAAVMKITPDGTATKVFEGKEFGVQTLRVMEDGSLLVATSPDGKLYRMPAGGGVATVVFDVTATKEKPKYIWDIATIGDSVFVATGAPAVVYRVPKGGGASEVLFQTTDQHIRCLMMAENGVLWAGSDGAGVIYRIATNERGAKPFAAYAAAKREITALAMDKQGNVYAAGVGAKGGASLPPLPVTGAVGVSITFVQPLSATAASANALVPEGSEIYRIGANGAPAKLLTLKEDVVYALAVRNGALLAATGNRGRVYRLDTEVPGRFTDVAHLEASQGMAFAPVRDGLLVATSNSGKVFRLRDRLTSPAMYTSAVFDAQGFSKWGRAEVRSATPNEFDLYVRSGNVESPLMGWSDWVKVAADAAGIGAPSARYVQWKAVLREGATIDAVGLNYLQANVAPVVDDVVVQPGARVAANAGVPPNAVVQISFPAMAAAVPMFAASPDAGPLAAQKDKTAVTVRWSAHDDNGDDMMFSLFYKGEGETNWRLLKDRITERYYSFDSALLPDGSYSMKVMASDAPVHADAETMCGDKMSERFVVDTTPPVPGALTVTMERGKIHARLEAKDATSPIAHAEFSVDAGPWQYVEPAGGLSDSLAERYDFLAAIPAAMTPVADAKEHVLAVRVYDRAENMTTVKTMVR